MVAASGLEHGGDSEGDELAGNVTNPVLGMTEEHALTGSGNEEAKPDMEETVLFDEVNEVIEEDSATEQTGVFEGQGAHLDVCLNLVHLAQSTGLA